MEKNIKKFFNSIKGRASFDLTEEMPQHYQYIENFDNTTEEECIKLDNKNKDIYKHNVDLYKNITEKLKKHNAMIKLETAPAPPAHPNNYEKFVMHKTRNISKNVRHQSFAVIYLIDKGYKMCLNDKTKEIQQDIFFEPYEAIEIVEKLENNDIENIIKIKENNRLNITPNYNVTPSAPPMYMPIMPQSSSLYNIPLSSSLPPTIPLTLERSKSELDLNVSQTSNSMPQLNQLSHSLSQTNLVQTNSYVNNYNRHKSTF
jgi:hypothetical protein